MKKILVPTDFSNCSKNALRAAADIAKKNRGCEIHLVHSFEKPMYGYTLQFGIDHEELKRQKETIQEEMHRLASEPYLKGIKTVLHYIADQELWELINDESFADIDLVVMGTHGAKGWKEIFVGSNTQKVVQLSNHPVLAIKGDYSNFKVKNLVFGSSFNAEYLDKFPLVKTFSEMYKAELTFLKINTPNFFETTPYSMAMMTEFSKKAGIKKFEKRIFNDVSVEDGIVNYCAIEKPDLIVMETHGRTGVAHLLNGSITENVVNNVDIPVLSIRIGEPVKVTKKSKKSKK